MDTQAVRATTAKKPQSVQSATAPHYGILIGGPKAIDWTGKGEKAIGHQVLPRRAMAEFTSIQVGRRNDSEEALSNTHPSLHEQWYINPARIVEKTAYDCIMAVYKIFGEQGFTVLHSLTGMGFDRANAIFAEVLPSDVASRPLVDVSNYLSTATFEGPQDELRNELLVGANTSIGYLTEYVRASKGEVSNALKTGIGKKGLDPLDIEYFRELKEPLPEEVPALATLAMGKELGQQFANSNKTDALLEQLIEQNRLQAEANRLLMEQNSKQSAAVPAAKSKGK